MPEPFISFKVGNDLKPRLADSANEGISRFQESNGKAGAIIEPGTIVREAARAVTPIIDRPDRHPAPKGTPKGTPNPC